MLKVEKPLEGLLAGRYKREVNARKAQKEVRSSLSPVPQILLPFFSLSPGEVISLSKFAASNA